MQLDQIPTSGRSPAGPQSNQNVWVLPAISRDVFAQTVVRRAVIMWGELAKRANPSYIIQEDEDRTRCNRHVRQPSLAQHALDANTWAGGGSLGYFAHASAKLTKAQLSQISLNV